MKPFHELFDNVYMNLYTQLKAASIWKGWGRQKAEQLPSDCRQIVYTEYFFSKWSSFFTVQPSRITLRFTHTIVSPGVGIVASFFGASIIRWDMDIIIISIIIVILLFTCQGYRCKNPNCDVDVHEWCREVWSFLGPRGPLVLPLVDPRTRPPVRNENLDPMYTGIYAS